MHVGNKPSESVRRAFSKKKKKKKGNFSRRFGSKLTPPALSQLFASLWTGCCNFQAFLPAWGWDNVLQNHSVHNILSHGRLFHRDLLGAAGRERERAGKGRREGERGSPARPARSPPSILPAHGALWVFRVLCPEHPGPREPQGDDHGWSCPPAAGIIKMHGWDVWWDKGGVRALGSRKAMPGAEVEPGCSLQAGRGTGLPKIGRS